MKQPKIEPQMKFPGPRGWKNSKNERNSKKKMKKKMQKVI